MRTRQKERVRRKKLAQQAAAESVESPAPDCQQQSQQSQQPPQTEPATGPEQQTSPQQVNKPLPNLNQPASPPAPLQLLSPLETMLRLNEQFGLLSSDHRNLP